MSTISPSATRPTAPTGRVGRWRVGVAVLALALVGLGAACGSDPDDTTTATGATTAPEAGATAVDDRTDPGDTGTGDTGTTDEFGDVDACGLLEGVDVASILGVPVGEAVTEETYGDFVCDVRPADDSVRAQFKLVVDTDNGRSNFPRQREMAADPEPVDGLGDEAFRSGANLFVLDGPVLVHVNVVRAESASEPLTTDQLTGALDDVLDALNAG